jgi:hypothetical protein
MPTLRTRMSFSHWDGPPLDAWRPWTPEQTFFHLSGVGIPWCLVGGWAIDLFLGAQTRPHDDIEIAVTRQDFSMIRDHLAAFKLHVVGDGEVRVLPAGGVPADEKHQNWVLDETTNAWRIDIMLEPGDAHTWVFRRDARISAARRRMVDRRNGIPFLKPEGVLLYKAKQHRDKDEADFDACLPRMHDDSRAWLKRALEVVHPDHAWLERLRERSGSTI